VSPKSKIENRKLKLKHKKTKSNNLAGPIS